MNSVAATILQQLGGKKFIAMTGAKNLVGSDTSLKMDVPHARCNDKPIKGVRIILSGNDTYSIEAFRILKLEYIVVDTIDNVFVENLPANFTRLTGLATTL